MSMVMKLLANKDWVRILHAVGRKPMRFGELQKELRLNPAQVDRAVKFLRKGLWIIPRVAPSGKGRLRVEYEIGKRGRAFLDAFKAFSVNVSRRKTQLGPSVTAELKSFTR